MDKLDKEIAVEKFVNTVEGTMIDIEKLISFLRIDDEKQKKMLEMSIDIIHKKIKKVKKCEDIDEAKKYLKVKKVVKKYGEK